MAMLRQAENHSMRGANKELDWAQSYDEQFHRLADTDIFRAPDKGLEPNSSDDLSQFFDITSPANESGSMDNLPMPDWDARQSGGEADDSVHQALQYLEQSAASPLLRGYRSAVYSKSSAKAAASDPELINIDPPFALPVSNPISSTVSSPPTPSPSTSRASSNLASSRNLCQSLAQRSSSSGVRKPSRKDSPSPKMMRASHYRPDLWAKRMEVAAEKFNLPPSLNSPVTPPLSTKIKQEDVFGMSTDPCVANPTVTLEDISPTNTSQSGHSSFQLTPLPSPTSNYAHDDRTQQFQRVFNPATTQYVQQYMGHDQLQPLQTPPPSDRLPMTAWGTDSNDTLDFSFSDSTDFGQKTQHWWSSASASQPCATTYQAAPANLHGLSIASTDLANSGLLIQCDPPRSMSDPSGMSSHYSRNTHPNAAAAALPVYTPTYQNGHPHAHPLVPPTHPAALAATAHNLSLGDQSPHTSPSSSPQMPARIRRMSRQRKQSATHLHQHHRRRSSVASSSSIHNTASSGNGSAGSSNIGFVNFTPHDSKKILTGVAPSGSSKTKARREKEAAEKRRKLSEAAVRAVIQAGGDLTALEKEGLLSLES